MDDMDITLGGAEKSVWLNDRLDQNRLVQIELFNIFNILGAIELSETVFINTLFLKKSKLFVS